MIGDSSAAGTVMAGLDDSDELVVTAAAVACGKIKDGIDAQKLVNSLNHFYYGVRYCAMNSLVQIGDPAIKPLIDFLSSGQWQTGLVYAVEALGQIGTKKALPIFESFIKSEDWSLRGSVAEALGNIKEKKSKKILEKTLENEKHPFVLGKIKSSLTNLRQK
jgi:HEAT repeat protein